MLSVQLISYSGRQEAEINAVLICNSLEHMTHKWCILDVWNTPTLTGCNLVTIPLRNVEFSENIQDKSDKHKSAPVIHSMLVTLCIDESDDDLKVCDTPHLNGNNDFITS